MLCLNNFFGIRQACAGGVTPLPRSGMYIESHPGLTKKALQAIEPGIFLNAQAFLNEMVQDAARTVITVDMRAALEPYVRTVEELEFGTVGTFTADLLSNTPAPRGLRVRKNAGAMGKLLISRVWVAYDTAGTYTVTITDGIRTETHEVTVATPSERVGLFVHFETDQDRVDMTIDAGAGKKPLTGDISKIAEFASASCDSCSSRSTYRTLSARGLYAGSETDAVQGIAADVAIVCGLEAAVCLMAMRLKVPLFMATVMKILENWEATSRLNFYAQHKQEWVAAEYERIANHAYPQAWDLHSKGMARYLEQLDPLCVTCGTGTGYGYSRFPKA